jgi:dihydrofolate reductase
MIISLIVAMSENRVIGVDNKLPWHIPEDLKHFKKVTSGHPMIMGRKTYDSIGRALPNRTNIVITRNAEFHAEHVHRADSLGKAIGIAEESPGKEEIFIIGGGEIFRQSLGVANRIYLTTVHTKIAGDVFFPEIPPGFMKVKEEKLSDSPSSTFSVWEKSKLNG